MKSQFKTERYFSTNDGWFIVMRPGDELAEIHHIKPRIKKCHSPDMIVAGPFINKVALEHWFIDFLLLYAKPRKSPVNYISDDIILPGLNNFDL